MNRFFTAINLLGVIAVCAVCLVQWKAELRQEIRLDELTQIRHQQDEQLQTQAQKLKETAADLADLRQRLTLAETQSAELQERLTAAVAERDALKTQTEQLKTSLSEWMQASADRDKTIEQQQLLLQQLTAARDEAVIKFNELAGKYNKLVGADSQRK